jgi:hypothetical protein
LCVAYSFTTSYVPLRVRLHALRFRRSAPLGTASALLTEGASKLTLV